MSCDYHFETSCINSTAELIHAMLDRATESSLEELREFCGDVDKVFANLGYSEDFPIEGDWHVSYHRSIYDDQPCFYFVWSAIEYIFTYDRGYREQS